MPIFRQHLKSIAAAGETLLQIALVCRKHETEREQLLPLGLPPLSKQMFAEETKVQENEEKKLAEALKDSEQPREQLEEVS